MVLRPLLDWIFGSGGGKGCGPNVKGGSGCEEGRKGRKQGEGESRKGLFVLGEH